MNKILLLELNEVPFRVIDYYSSRKPGSALAGLLSSADQYETFTEDKLALDPWISWPTIHRGVTDEEHQILHLGQVLNEVDKAYPPIWKILKNSGIKVGVFGSLHSSTVPSNATDYSFYLPDYFDNKVFAHPKSLSSFQELNLAMTRQSARNVTRKLPWRSALKFALDAPRLGVTPGTIAAISSHLARETLDRSLRIRRRNFQPVVTGDLFFFQLNAMKPQFASFYTNHVAAAMHRYWGATFPGDFEKGSLEKSWIEQYSGEITAAMDVFDSFLRKSINFINANPDYRLVVASSMGQAAIPAQHTYEFLTITDMDCFMRGLGLPEGSWELRPAMVPCQCVIVPESHRGVFIKSLESMGIGTAKMLRSTKPQAPMSYDERERGFFQVFIQFDNYVGDSVVTLDGRKALFPKLGLGTMAHEDGVNCTAQHVPTGSLLVQRPSARPANSTKRKQISTVDFVPSVLTNFSLTKPNYMRGQSSIAFS